MNFNKSQSFLYNITIEEFFKEFKTIVRAEMSAQETDTTNIDWVMAQTGFAKNTIYQKVSAGEIPVLFRKKPLRFSKRMIREWLASGSPTNAENKINEAIRGKRKQPISFNKGTALIPLNEKKGEVNGK